MMLICYLFWTPTYGYFLWIARDITSMAEVVDHWLETYSDLWPPGHRASLNVCCWKNSPSSSKHLLPMLSTFFNNFIQICCKTVYDNKVWTVGLISPDLLAEIPMIHHVCTSFCTLSVFLCSFLGPSVCLSIVLFCYICDKSAILFPIFGKTASHDETQMTSRDQYPVN